MTQAPDTAAFRAVLDSVFAAPAYRWADTPGFLLALRRWWHQLGDWLDGLRMGSPLAFQFVIAVCLLGLLFIFAHAVYVAYRTVRGSARAGRAADLSSPVMVGDAAWYDREADCAAADGRLLEALQLAFAALALRLDAQGLLRYHPSMTPAECARAARLTDSDKQRLRGLVGTLYTHVFAGAPCGLDDYRRWREASTASWQALPHAAAH
jgi:hypothetical protein